MAVLAAVEAEAVRRVVVMAVLRLPAAVAVLRRAAVVAALRRAVVVEALRRAPVVARVVVAGEALGQVRPELQLLLKAKAKVMAGL